MNKYEKRFWEKVKLPEMIGTDECWIWQAGKTKKGYGHFQIKDKVSDSAHRVAYQLCIGVIPKGIDVLHNCPTGDNRACVNPAHLWLGTHADNNKDRKAKGRSAIGIRHANAKLTEDQVKQIRNEYSWYKITQKDLAKKFGVSPHTIHFILHRITWTHVL